MNAQPGPPVPSGDDETDDPKLAELVRLEDEERRGNSG
jgi:hypothetical protein